MHLAVKIGDVATAAQMVRMVVELHLFVIVLVMEIIIYSRTCAGIHGPCLCCLRRVVVAAELSCKREESELTQAFPSAADNVF